MGLQQQLDELTAKLQAMVPAERLAVVQSAMDEIRASGAGAHALKTGNRAPMFELPDGDG